MFFVFAKASFISGSCKITPSVPVFSSTFALAQLPRRKSRRGKSLKYPYIQSSQKIENPNFLLTNRYSPLPISNRWTHKEDYTRWKASSPASGSSMAASSFKTLLIFWPGNCLNLISTIYGPKQLLFCIATSFESCDGVVVPVIDLPSKDTRCEYSASLFNKYLIMRTGSLEAGWSGVTSTMDSGRWWIVEEDDDTCPDLADEAFMAGQYREVKRKGLNLRGE